MSRLDWMYQGPDCNTKIKTSEDVLLGTSGKEPKQEEKKHFTPIFQESYSNPKNELFTKIHEDPMLIMKKEELKQRKEIEDNPYKMKILMKEIEDSLQGKREKKSKKEKKNKKEKKEKKSKKSKKDRYDTSSDEKDDSHRKRNRSNSDSSTQSYCNEKNIKSVERHFSNKKQKYDDKRSDRSRSRSCENKDKYSRNNKPKKDIKENYSNNSRPSTSSYGLVDRFGKKLGIETPKVRSYGPDESLYEEKIKNLEREKESRRRKSGNNMIYYFKDSDRQKYKNLSQEEREEMIRDMEKKAHLLDISKSLKSEIRLDQIEKSENKNRSSSNKNEKPDFLRNVEKEVYNGKMDMSDRVKRNQANIQRQDKDHRY